MFFFSRKPECELVRGYEGIITNQFQGDGAADAEEGPNTFRKANGSYVQKPAERKHICYEEDVTK